MDVALQQGFQVFGELGQFCGFGLRGGAARFDFLQEFGDLLLQLAHFIVLIILQSGIRHVHVFDLLLKLRILQGELGLLLDHGSDLYLQLVDLFFVEVDLWIPVWFLRLTRRLRIGR